MNLLGWPRTLRAKVKQRRQALAAFLKSEWAGSFWKSRVKRRLIRRSVTRPSSAFHAVVVIPMDALAATTVQPRTCY
jgi:hypothetical protein